MVYLVVSMLALYFDELSSNCAKVYSFYWAKIVWNLGSGGGSVTRAVASDSEVRGSNPFIGKKLNWTFTVNCIEKTKIKKKRLGMAHLKICLKLIFITSENARAPSSDVYRMDLVSPKAPVPWSVIVSPRQHQPQSELITCCFHRIASWSRCHKPTS